MLVGWKLTLRAPTSDSGREVVLSSVLDLMEPGDFADGLGWTHSDNWLHLVKYGMQIPIQDVNGYGDIESVSIDLASDSVRFLSSIECSIRMFFIYSIDYCGRLLHSR